MDPQLTQTLSALEAWARQGAASGEPGPPEPIRELHIELTHRCNQRCVMCHHWMMPSRDPGSVGREMTLDQIRRLVEGSESLRAVQIVVLSGGEPWLRPDLAQIAAFLSGHYPDASIGVLSNFGNARMIRDKLAELRERGVRRLWLGSSLDGLERTHDLIRGRPGAFQGLLETSRMLCREFPGTDFSFNFTITPRNYKELWPAYELASEMGVWFGAQMVVNQQGLDAPEVFHWRDPELDEVERQIDRIILDLFSRHQALERIRQEQARQSSWLWTRLLYWHYLKKYAREPERYFQNCLAGRRYAMFSPEGNLFFCPVNKHRTVGNVDGQTFDELWRSPRAEAERAYAASGRCNCWLNCIANPVLDQAVARGMP